MTFFEKLKNRVCSANTFLCVGLDPVWSKIPNHIPRTQFGLLDFLTQIVNCTSDQAAVFKLNFAYFESLGPPGMEVLGELIKKIPHDIPVIGDAKRGDVGHSSEMYAKSIFENFNCDAITVNPYLGGDSLRPFFDYIDRGVFVLCLTSNPGAVDLQFPELFLRVATKVKGWNTYGNAGLVVGATRPDYISEIRKNCGEMPFLMPGVGAQGGDLAKSLFFAEDNSKIPYVINASRSIIYASSSEDYAEKARIEAKNIRNKINLCRSSS